MYDISDYSDALRNLSAAYESKLKNLSEIRDITLELKCAIEADEEVIADDFDDFDVFYDILNRREIKIDERNIIMTTINHYKSQLPPDMLEKINSDGLGGGEKDGYDFITAEKTIYEDIQAIENFNLIHMKILMDNVKKKLDNVRKNRIIMDKFVVDDADIKTGALINKKK